MATKAEADERNLANRIDQLACDLDYWLVMPKDLPSLTRYQGLRLHLEGLRETLNKLLATTPVVPQEGDTQWTTAT